MRNVVPAISRAAIFIAVLAALVLACGERANNESGTVRQQLKVVTYNLWHGLNPRGLIKFEESESPAERETRRQGFYKFVRRIDPDILFLQEVNPAPAMAARIGRDLGYDAVNVVDNAGLKIGALGLPTNFRSGQAILAKPDMQLRALGKRKLSGGFGWTAWHSSFQFGEFRDAIAASVTINGRRVLLMGIHTHHGPEADEEIRAALDELVQNETITAVRRQEIIATFELASERRRSEITKALELAEATGLGHAPMLFAGDFNSSPQSPELLWLKGELGFRSTTVDDDPDSLLITWDHKRNKNTHFFHDFVPVNKFEPEVMRVLNRVVVTASKRLDYILYRNCDDFFGVVESGLFADELHEERYASDHFGIYAIFEKSN